MACCLLGLACGYLQPAQSRYEQELADAPPAERHPIHDERLQQIMRGMDRVSDDRLPKELNLEPERDRRVDEIVAVAESMAESARQIMPALAASPLAEGERRDLQALAGLFEQRARALAREAPRLSPSEMQSALADIQQTCDACHARYRSE